MKAQQTFSILFWVNKNRLKNGKAPLSIRITVDGKRAEVSAHREVSLLEWDARAQMVTGRNQEAKENDAVAVTFIGANKINIIGIRSSCSHAICMEGTNTL